MSGAPPPAEDQPTAGYAVVMGVFSALATAFTVWFRRSGRPLPERMPPGDLALLTVAAHKLARLVTKDKVTRPVRAPFTVIEGRAGPGELAEHPRYADGPGRVLGEMAACPLCLSMWTSAAFTAGWLVAPRVTRWVATLFTMFFGAELLQLAYKRAGESG